jgi:glycosyltransferase involved in cell wall biosynthesis
VSAIGPGDGRTAVIVARNDLTRDNRTLKMAAALAKGGRRVTAIGIVTTAGQPLEEAADFGTIVRLATTRRLAAQTPAVVAPGRAKLPAARASAIGALRDFLGRSRDGWLLFRAARALEPSVAVVADADSAVAAWLIQRIARVPVIYDVREIWVEMHADSHWLYKRLYSAAERLAFRSAAAVVTTNELAAEELTRRYGAREVTGLYNGASECVTGNTGVSSPVRLLFQGTFAVDRDLDVLVRAMPALRGVATLALQGWGDMESHIRSLVEQLGIGDIVTMVPPCAPADVVRSATAYDVGVISYRATSLNLYLSSPNKLFDYLGAGLAIAAPNLPFMSSLIRRFGCGAIIRTETPEALSEGLLALVRDPDRIAQMKANAPDACRETCWDAQAASLERIVTGIEQAAR